jgi:membrane fusion protein (multidrug efflux system)
MALEAQDRDPGEQSPPEFSKAQPAPANGQAPGDGEEEGLRSRAPLAHECSPGQRRARELSPQGEALYQTRDREDAAEPRKGLLRRHPIGFFLALLLFIFTAAAGSLFWDYAKRFESTDDAFIAARQFAIAPKVSGYLTAVPVTDNQHVAAGDMLARIDERDYRVALEQAQAQVASAEAGIQNIDAQIKVQEAQIASNQAQLDQARAALVFAQQQAARFQDLAQKGAGSVMNAQQYTSQLNQQEAAVQSAKANLALAQRQIESLKAQRESAIANLAQAKAQRDQAQLNLSYTTVIAAEPGRVVQLSAAVGQFVQAGTNLTMFVPDEIWVAANFKETQLDAMRPGQPVSLSIDAYPERTIHGHIASVQPGSGTAFSLLPAENATGNYVKIVQRVPVKIIMDNPPTDVALGPGMSVVPTVQVSSALSLVEKLRACL